MKFLWIILYLFFIDLSWDIEEKDIYQGLSVIGEVKFVDVIDPEYANVCIKLRYLFIIFIVSFWSKIVTS